MELQVVGKNVEVTQQVKDYLSKKMKKLIRYLPNVEEAKVEIQEEKTKSPDHRLVVQVTLRNKGDILRSEERSSSINSAIDSVTEVLSRRIERYKGKFDKKARGAMLARNVSSELLESERKETNIEQSTQIVKVKRFLVRSMDVTEAAEQMELLSHDFFLFLNSKNGELNLIYRRKDGNYGIIEPELG